MRRRGWTVDESTAHTFRIQLADPSQVERAVALLEERVSAELTCGFDAASTDRMITIASTFSPRGAAVQRPLNVLRRGGFDVSALVFDDLLEEQSAKRLRQIINGWIDTANRGPWRRRAESLSGAATMETLHAMAIDADGQRRRAALFVMGCAAFNTASCEPWLAHLAARSDDATTVEALVGMLVERASLARLLGDGFTVDDADLVGNLVTLMSGSGYAAERVVGMLGLLEGPHSGELRSALEHFAARNTGERAERALFELQRVDADDELRGFLGTRIADGAPGVRGVALEVAAHHWGTELRPVWEDFLRSRSAPLRLSAETAIGLHGTSDDIELAAEHLARIIRAKPAAFSAVVPRGAAIIDLLSRHPTEPIAVAALGDLAARWDRLDDDLRVWLDEHHPALHPDAGHPIQRVDELDGGAEADTLVWPLPDISDDDDGTMHLAFGDTEMSEIRERFEDLAEQSAQIRVIDADREWMLIEIVGEQPVEIITALWSRAHDDVSPPPLPPPQHPPPS